MVLRRYPTTNKGTAIGAAMDYVRSSMFAPSAGRRQDSPKLVIILTDGESQEEPAVVAAAARRLRETGAKLLVLGITLAVNIGQLREIAGTSGHVVLKEAFEQLGPAAIVELGLESICPHDPTAVSTTVPVTSIADSTTSATAATTTTAAPATTTNITATPLTTTSTTSVIATAKVSECPGAKYLLNGICFKICPSGMTHVGNSP